VGKLISAGIVSLDGYIADEHGDFSWATPDDDLHALVNELERPVGTHLYGRRMYEVMRYWETADAAVGAVPTADVVRDYAAIWQAADKIVYSSTLQEVFSRRTRLHRRFDPEEIRALKEASDRDLSIGGPGLAAEAFRAGLVDEVRMFVHPVVVGGGTALLPRGVRSSLELIDERRLASGVVVLRYTVLGDLA